MTNYKICLLLILAIGMYSCNSEVKSKSTKKDNSIENIVLPDTVQTESKKETKYRDTIAINYKEHKTLLDILKIVPEATMDSWQWTEKDRIKTVDFIERNNFLIDSTELYYNIKYIKPNTIGIQVVDGFWTLSIYKFNVNHYFIVTNDIVGDGNDIQTFSLINNKLIPTKMINWFSDFDYKLLSNTTPNCIEALEANELSYDYDFTNETKVIISSWLLNKNESKNCFNGNVIVYKLNKEAKTFDITNICWKSDENECETQNNQTKSIDIETNINKTSENTNIQAKKEAFLESLKNRESLSKYFNNNWSLIYHEDNRCDGSTDGELNNLVRVQIDSLIKIQVKNDGNGWACDKKEPKDFVFNFSITKLIKNWDRFEIEDNQSDGENSIYILGAGESDYLKLHYNDDELITKLEYKSEDPG